MPGTAELRPYNRGPMPRYGPPDAFETPRFSGPRTFMRPARPRPGRRRGIVGIPTDGAVVYRTGARFGPEGIRSVSVTLRNYNPLLGVDVVDRLSLVDYGDVPTVPGSTADSLERSTAALAEIARAGVTTVCLGGDHTVLLAELRPRACARPARACPVRLAPRPLGRVLRAEALPRERRPPCLEEGLIDPPGRSRPACAGR